MDLNYPELSIRNDSKLICSKSNFLNTDQLQKILRVQQTNLQLLNLYTLVYLFLEMFMS